MVLKEAVESYIIFLEDQENTTGQTYRPKVEKFSKLYGNLEITEALSKDKLEKFIFKNDQKCIYKYYSLFSFYKFVFGNLLDYEDIRFPVNKKKVEAIDEERERSKVYIRGRNVGGITYLPDGFDFQILFNPKFYNHLNNEIAAKTIKAIMALGLSLGCDSKHFFDGKTNTHITLDNVNVINSEEIEVSFFLDKDTIINRNIKGNISKYVIDYYSLRKDFNDKGEAFFIKLWSGYNLDYETKFANGKPARVKSLMLYFLKYISDKLYLPEQLNITDLKYNMIYHFLMNSKGVALNEIVRSYGYPYYVQHAFNRFTEHIDSVSDTYFDFFNLASSTINDKEIEDNTNNNVDEADIVTKISIMEKRVRNKPKVKQLKVLYDNKCQICNKSLTLIDDIEYSEVHHIHPLGKEHMGKDEKDNMIVLCPNHHKLFDLGIIAINPVDMKSIITLDNKNHHFKEITSKHTLSETCVRYHYEMIFKMLKKELYTAQG